MARKGTINEFYDLKALQAQHQTAIDLVEDFINKVNSVKPVAVGLQGATNTAEILSGIEAVTRAQNLAADAALKAAKASETEAKAREKNAKAANTEAKTLEQAAKSKEREEKSRKANERTIEREAAARAKEEAKLKAAANEYLQLSRAYQAAALEAKTYYLTLGESHPTTIQAVADAKAMDDILKKVDASVGQHQRNVGNYGSAFSGLSRDFGQIARELPALAINANTFFLAISNNIPNFIDSMQTARAEIANLTAQGQRAPTMFQALSKAIFSFNTVMVLAVTALTLFGGKLVDWIGSLFKGADAVGKIIGSLEKMNKELEVSDKKVKDFADQLDFLAAKRKIDIEIQFLNDPSLGVIKNLGKDASDTYDKMALLNNELLNTAEVARKAEFEALRALQLDENFKGATVSDALGLAPEDLEELDKNTRRALRTYQTIKERRDSQQTEATRLSQQLELTQKQVTLEEAKRQKEINEKAEEARKKRAEKAKEYAKAERQAQYEYDRQRIQDEINLQKSLADTKTGSDGSVAARSKQVEAEKKLIMLTRDFELGAENVTATQKLLIRTNANRDIKAAEVKLVSDILAIRQSIAAQAKAEGQAEIDNFTKVQEEKKKKIADTAEEGFQRTVGQIQRLTDIELTNLNQRYAAGKISKTNYEKEKLAIENRARKESIQAEIDFYTFMLTLYEFDKKAQEEYLKKIALLRKQLSGVGVEDAKKDADAIKKALIAIGTELRGLTFDLFSASLEKQKNAIQEQIDLLERRKQKDIETEQARVQSTQDRAAAIATIEARANAEKEILQQRQRKLDIEKAKFDKANAITGIIQNTALAVSEYGFFTPLGLLAAALGAIQVARVLAQPIPKYAEGTLDHPGGKAIVGDGGKKELVLTPDGRYMITKDTAQTVDLPRHSIVLPDAEAALLHSTHRQTVMTSPVFHQPSHSLQKEFKQLRQAIISKKENHFKFPSTVQHYMKSGQTWTQIRKG